MIVKNHDGYETSIENAFCAELKQQTRSRVVGEFITYAPKDQVDDLTCKLGILIDMLADQLGEDNLGQLIGYQWEIKE